MGDIACRAGRKRTPTGWILACGSEVAHPPGTGQPRGCVRLAGVRTQGREQSAWLPKATVTTDHAYY